MLTLARRFAEMSRKSVHDTPTIQSLDRGLAILEAVAGSPVPVPLKQLTDLIGIDRSSVFRLANTLRQRRFLANPKGSNDYILGPTAWLLSRRYGRTVLGTFFHHHLQDLSGTLGETSHFAVREGVEVFFIDHHIPTGQVVSVAGQTGEFAPLHCTAHGRALLADCDLPALRELLGRAPLRVYTSTTVRSVTRLALVCAQVRADPRSAGPDRRIGRHLVAADAAAHARRRPRRRRSQENRPRHHRLARQLMVPRYTSS
jgi:IclR family acetate operon transcriptional repressor